MPTVTDRAEASHTAGRMSKGLSAPQAPRTEAMVAGSSWMEAVFSTTSRHSSSLATPPQPRAIRRAAWIPRGVAALPSPSRLADTLADRAARVCSSRLARGISRRSSGRNTRARPADRPQAFMISMTPLHRHSTPAMETESSTAEAAPSMAASATASSRPVSSPNTRDSTTIPVQIQVIAIRSPPVTRVRPIGGNTNISELLNIFLLPD